MPPTNKSTYEPACRHRRTRKYPSLENALDCMLVMEPTQPYALGREDKKRKLIQELKTIAEQLSIKPVVIGGLAVTHHGYVRTTRDVDILVARNEASSLTKYLKATLGWTRTTEGFKHTSLDVDLDICVEGDKTSPHWQEYYPHPNSMKLLAVVPLPVPCLADLLALKAKSGRVRDDADVVELLKQHWDRKDQLTKRVVEKLSSESAREHFRGLVKAAHEERRRRNNRLGF